MAWYGKFNEHNVLVQKQPYEEDGFEPVPDNAVCGMIKKGNSFIAPKKVERDYREVRQEEYPPIGEQLDAIWMELNQRRLNGEALVQDADNMLGKILSVKAKYPKNKKGKSK
jgi:hypothetical protein